MYDEAVLGPIADFEEFAEYLRDYEENWHMGNDHDMHWINAVLNGVPSLLSVGYDKDNVSVSFLNFRTVMILKLEEKLGHVVFLRRTHFPLI